MRWKATIEFEFVSYDEKSTKESYMGSGMSEEGAIMDAWESMGKYAGSILVETKEVKAISTATKEP